MPSSMFGSYTMVTGGNFHQQNIHQHHPASKDPFERLLEVASPTAFHNSNDDIYDHPKCHPNTRVAVLNKIMDWVRGLDPETCNALVMWLYGPAGSGKSAIGRSIAERCYEEGILLASYFFSRSDPTRNHGRSFIATIAYQISIHFPDIRDHLIGTIHRDPLIFTRSLDAQILALIVEPMRDRIDIGYFNTTDTARLVIIDGLDECQGRESQVKILTTISQALQQHRLPFIFLVASRPEHDIRSAFDVGCLREHSTRIVLNDDYLPSEDIRLFLQDKFTDIQQTHPFREHLPPMWPSRKILQTLVGKSSGQFIYASTVIKFIQSSRHRPHQRLDIALGIRPVHREMPFAELDGLYKHILSSVGDTELITRILALQCFSAGPTITVDYMEELLSLNEGDISEMLCDLTALIFEDDFHVLEPFHKSLWDFLKDKSRSDNFWIDNPVLRAELGRLYIRHFKKYPQTRLHSGGFDIWDFLHNFLNALPTQDLCDDLTNFSFVVFLVDAQVLNGIPYFLASIKSREFNGLDLHGQELQRFDQFAQGIMEETYSDSSLAALVAVASMKVDWSRFQLGRDHLFQRNKAHWTLDKLSFRGEVHINPEYGRFISEFVENHNRSGTYALNGQRYAIAAVYLLKQIRNNWEQKTPSNGPYKRRESIPWLWLGLKCLVHVLPRSDISEELTLLARQLKFGPLSWEDNREKNAVKREIALYLARVE